MQNIKEIVTAALALIVAISLLVGIVLRHYVGGFIRIIEKEEEQREEN